MCPDRPNVNFTPPLEFAFPVDSAIIVRWSLTINEAELESDGACLIIASKREQTMHHRQPAALLPPSTLTRMMIGSTYQLLKLCKCARQKPRLGSA